ncbi:hypothetical protein BSKO_07473 [Bryopsis sp. KO-2023]|nr:hypothetical protein BSKO_07473 [Bryopsis sp. KO-2023]
MERATFDRREPEGVRDRRSRQDATSSRRGDAGSTSRLEQGSFAQNEITPYEGSTEQDSRSQTTGFSSTHSVFSSPEPVLGEPPWLGFSPSISELVRSVIHGLRRIGGLETKGWQPIASLLNFLSDARQEFQGVARCIRSNRCQEAPVATPKSAPSVPDIPVEVRPCTTPETEVSLIPISDPLGRFRDQPDEWPESDDVETYLEQALGDKIPVESLTICSGPPVRYGSNASIFGAYWEGIHVAVKVTRPRNGQPKREFLDSFVKNVTLLTGIEHPNVVRVYGWCLIDRGGGKTRGGSCEPAVVMDWCDGGSLATLMMRNSDRPVRLSWREKVQIARDYAEATMHLHGDCQMLLGKVDLGSLLVNRMGQNGNTVVQGKISDLSQSRFMLSRIPSTRGRSLPDGPAREANSTQSDMYIFSQILWCFLVLDQPCSEFAYWTFLSETESPPDHCLEFFRQFRGLAPSRYEGWGGDPPLGLVSVMERAGRDRAEERPTFTELCYTLDEILADMSEGKPREDVYTILEGSAVFPCLEMNVSCSLENGGHDPGPSRIEPSQEGPTHPTILNKPEQKSQRTFSQKVSKGVLSWCRCISVKADSSTTTEELSEPREHHPGQEIHTNYFGISTIESLEETEISPEFTRPDSDPQTGRKGEVRIFSRLPMSPDHWGTLKRHLGKLDVAGAGGGISTSWAAFIRSVQRTSERLSSTEWSQFLDDLFRPELKESNPRMWAEVYGMVVGVSSAKDLIPGAGFGVSGKHLDQIVNVALSLCEFSFRSLKIGRRRSWVFELESSTGSTGNREERNDADQMHTAVVSVGQKRFSVTHLMANGSLGATVKHSKRVDSLLKKQLAELLPETEDIEEIVDALKHAKTDQVLAWVVHTEVAKLHHSIPSLCSFKGICHAPLALVSEYFECRSMFEILEGLRCDENGVGWKWMDKLVLARRIARALCTFHSNGVSVGTLTSKTVMVSGRLDIRIELSPLRFVDGSFPAGDPEWIAPEKWRGLPIGPPNDIYSFGIILWELVSNTRPWSGRGPSEILVSVVGGRRPAVDGEWDREYVALMRRCWAADAENRPSSTEVFDQLTAMQEAARELVSLSSGSEGSALEKVRLGMHYDSRYMKSWSSQGSVHRTVTVGSTPSEIQPDPHVSGGTGRSSSLDRVKGESSDILKVEIPSNRDSMQSTPTPIRVEELNDQEHYQKLQDNTVVNELVMIRDLKGGTGKLCQNRFSGVVHVIERTKKWSMARPWTWKAEVLGPWPAWRSLSPISNFKRFFYVKNVVKEMSTEIAVLKKLRHPNLVTVHEVIEDGDNGMLLVSEFVKGRPLAEISDGEMRPISEGAAWDHVRDIIKGLDYLHSNHIVHGDLTPDSLKLTEQGNVKIKIGGLTRYCPGEALSQLSNRSAGISGDASFFAPEMCDTAQVRSYSGAKADIYALGVCLHLFVFGFLPFRANESMTLAEAIRGGKPTHPNSCGHEVSPALSDLLVRLLNKDPLQRITLDEMMAHQWISDKRRPIWPSSVLFRVPVEVSELEKKEAVTLNVARVFAGLPLVHSCKEQFSKGRCIVQRGKSTRGVYVIGDGLCRALPEGGGPAEGEPFFPGSVVGIRGFLSEDSAVAGNSVVATAPTTVTHVTHRRGFDRGVLWLGFGVVAGAVACDAGLIIVCASLLVCFVLCLCVCCNRVATNRLERLVNKLRRFGPAAGYQSADVF